MHVHGRVLGMEGPENKDAVLDLLALLPAPDSPPGNNNHFCTVRL